MRHHHPLRYYIYAGVLTLGAIAIQVLTRPYFASIAFIFFYPIIVLFAYNLGFGPSLLSLAFQVSAYFFYFSNFEAETFGFPQALRLAVFTGCGAVIAYFITKARNSTTQLQADVTKAKALEKELQEAIRSRDEFIAIASHELKTPLTTLLLQTQMVQHAHAKDNLKNYDPEQISMIMLRTENQVQRLNKLVEDMLDISRIQTGKLSLNPERQDLCKIMNVVIEHHSHLAHVSEIIFEHCQKALGYWDGFRIEQVFNNLLSNAIKYGKRNPVHISIKSTEEGYLVSFKDNGIGIDDENLERIFSRYERAISASEVSGLGLGLYISKYIVEAHRGKIWVKSLAGKGSEFFVLLPQERN